MLTRKVLFIITILISTVTLAQKPQKVAYIDMEYILENVPEYTEAQERLKARVITWQQRLDALKREIEIMKVDLSNEKALLTDELNDEREEDIQIKELDLKNLQAGYFGPTGDLYMLRKQLVKPVQDQIYNAIQEIAVQKKYDMVFDKSSDLIMLYSNKKYDLSEQVLNKIVKGRKLKAIEDKKVEKSEAAIEKEAKAKARAEEKTTKNQALKERAKAKEEAAAKKRAEFKKAQEEARAKKKAEVKKANEEKRKKRLAEIERRKKEREARIKAIEKAKKVKDSIKNNKN